MWYPGHARRGGGNNRQVCGCPRAQFVSAHLVARGQEKTVTTGRLNNDKANGKKKVRLECAAAVQFMRTRRWEALITICLEEGGTNNNG